MVVSSNVGFIKRQFLSGFNFTQKGLQTILESAMLGNPTLVVYHKDRLARPGFEHIKWLIELSGSRIHSLDAHGQFINMTPSIKAQVEEEKNNSGRAYNSIISDNGTLSAARTYLK